MCNTLINNNEWTAYDIRNIRHLNYNQKSKLLQKYLDMKGHITYQLMDTLSVFSFWHPFYYYYYFIYIFYDWFCKLHLKYVVYWKIYPNWLNISVLNIHSFYSSNKPNLRDSPGNSCTECITNRKYLYFCLCFLLLI